MQEGFATPCVPDRTVGDQAEELDRAAAPSPAPHEAAADQALTSAAADELTVLLQQFRQRIDDPLLPLPDPKVVRRRLFSVSKPATRRSKRIAAKGKATASSAIKRAQRILMQNLGICREDDRITDSQMKEYADIFASPLGPEQIAAIATLFGLSHAPATDGEDANVDDAVA
jgi:hypothetical protein